MKEKLISLTILKLRTLGAYSKELLYMKINLMMSKQLM